MVGAEGTRVGVYFGIFPVSNSQELRAFKLSSAFWTVRTTPHYRHTKDSMAYFTSTNMSTLFGTGVLLTNPSANSAEPRATGRSCPEKGPGQVLISS